MATVEEQLMTTSLDDDATGLDKLPLVKPEKLSDADLDDQLKQFVKVYTEEPLAHTGESEEGGGRATSCVRTRMHKYDTLARKLATLLKTRGRKRRSDRRSALALLQDFHRWYMYGAPPSAHLKPLLQHTKHRGGKEGDDVELLPIDATEEAPVATTIDLSSEEESGDTQLPVEAQRPRVRVKEEKEVDASSDGPEAVSGALPAAAGRPVTVESRLRPYVPDSFLAPSSTLRGRNAIPSAQHRPQLRSEPSGPVEVPHCEPARGVRGPARHGGKCKKFTPQATIVPQRLKDAYIGWATSGVSRITEGSAMDILDSVTIALSYMAAEGWENGLDGHATDPDHMFRTLRRFVRLRRSKPLDDYLSRRPTCDRVPKDLEKLQADIKEFLKFLSAEASANAHPTQKLSSATAPLTGPCELDSDTGDDFLEWATCRTPERPAVTDEHAQAALRDVKQVISQIAAASVGTRIVYRKNALSIWSRHRRLVEPLVVTDETVRESWKLFLCFLDAEQSDMPSESSFNNVSSDDNKEDEDRAVMGSAGGGCAAARKGAARSFTVAARTTGLFRSFKRVGHPASSSPAHSDAGAAEEASCPASPTDDSACDADFHGVPTADIYVPTDDKPALPHPKDPSEWLDAASQVVADIAHDLGTIRQLRQQTLDVRSSTLNMQAHLNMLLDGLHAHDAPAARARARLAAVGLCCDFS